MLLISASRQLVEIEQEHYSSLRMGFVVRCSLDEFINMVFNVFGIIAFNHLGFIALHLLMNRINRLEHQLRTDR
jgi:hypothetical protein